MNFVRKIGAVLDLQEVDRVRYYVSFSGGKDSTAMLLMLLEKGYQVDEILFADTGMEFDEVYRHIKKVENFIGRKIMRLKNNEYSFEQGLRDYGWAHFSNRWCTGMLKKGILNPYVAWKKRVMYVGIAADEVKRLKPKKTLRYPLAEWGITEKDALEYCYEKGFDWEGLYEKFDRLSCYVCPFKNLKELKTLYLYYPKYWNKLKELDKVAKNRGYKFRYKSNVEELEERFKREVESERKGEKKKKIGKMSFLKKIGILKLGMVYYI